MEEKEQGRREFNLLRPEEVGISVDIVKLAIEEGVVFARLDPQNPNMVTGVMVPVKVPGQGFYLSPHDYDEPRPLECS